MIISWYLDRYASLGAAEKEAKGSIISEIEDTVRRACGGGRGAFVRKHDEGGWVEIPVMQAVSARVAFVIRVTRATAPLTSAPAHARI